MHHKFGNTVCNNHNHIKKKMSFQAYITFKAGTDIAFLRGALLVRDRVIKDYCDTNKPERC